MYELECVSLSLTASSRVSRNLSHVTAQMIKIFTPQLQNEDDRGTHRSSSSYRGDVSEARKINRKTEDVLAHRGFIVAGVQNTLFRTMECIL